MIASSRSSAASAPAPTQHRPNPCDLRVWLGHEGVPQRDPTEFEQVLYRLGDRHEREHLATLGPYLDLSRCGEEERVRMARRIDDENHPEILLQVQLYGWLFERSCGVAPKALQVFSGMKEIVPVPYDGAIILSGRLSAKWRKRSAS